MANADPPYAQGAMHEGVLAVTIIPRQVREATLAYLLRDEILALVVSSQTQDLILDVRNVEFMGSVGFLAFLAVRRHLKTGRIVICNLSPTLREMFAVCKLISPGGDKGAPFETEATLEAALAQLAG